MSLELEFVVPGHYMPRNSTDGSKTPIRVLGEDPNHDDYFMIMDGANSEKSLHETVILREYVYSPTAIAETLRTDIGQLNFGNIEDSNVNPIDTYQDEEKLISTYLRDPEPPIVAENSGLNVSVSNYTDEEEFAINLIDKLKSSEIVTIELKIEIGADIQKLRDSIDMLNLNPTIVAKMLVRNYKNDNTHIVNSIVSLLKSKEEIVSNVVDNTEPEQVVEMVIQQENNEDEINQKLESIDERFKKYTNSILD